MFPVGDLDKSEVSLIVRRLQKPSPGWSRLWHWLLAPPQDRNHNSEDDQSEVEQTYNE